MGKHKHKKFFMSRADETLLGMIATLNCPLKPFTSAAEKDAAKIHIINMRDLLHNRTRRIADCILNPKLEDTKKIRRRADYFVDFARGLFAVENE